MREGNEVKRGTEPCARAIGHRQVVSVRPEMYDKRNDIDTEPLFEASQAFPAFEELALSARSQLCFGLRIFDPKTKLRTQAALDLGLRNWGELIAHLTGRGVFVRILLTDFEPVGAHDFHEMTWRAMKDFGHVIGEKGDPENFEAIAAFHQGEFGVLTRLTLWALLKRKAERLAAGKRGRGLIGFQSWRLFRNRGGQPGTTLNAPPRLFPATYHQKLAVADGEHAIIGGLDINERRYDDPDHKRGPEETWHDVSLKVHGVIASDILHHFDTCWNFEVPRFNARLTRMGEPQPGLPNTVSPVSGLELRPETAAEGNSVRLIRTRSRRSRSWYAIGPQPDVTEIEAAHLDLIARARDCLYLETQFLRSRRLAESLAQAAQDNRGLHLIVLLPAGPDDVVFEGNEGAEARYGEWLQVKAVDTISRAFGDRCGFFSLTRGVPGLETDEREAVEGEQIAYVHAKVAVADGKTAIVSSANLNGRSLRWDHEAGILWENPERVGDFQQQLWSQHLRKGFDPHSSASGADALKMWQSAAEAPAGGSNAPQVVSYPLEKARKFARYSLMIPETMI